MKYILTIGLLLSLVCCVVVYDVSADAPDAHGMADIRNATSEQERHQKVINEYIIDRDRFISLANDLKVVGGGAVGSLKTILVSTLTTTNHDKIATAFGLATRTVLSIYGSSSVASMIDSAISNANSYHGSAQYLYNNPTRLIGYDSANSAIEAWHKAGQATDHYNAYHSSVSENAPSPPIGPGNINLPQFECPGPCTNTYNTVSEASDVHYEKCGTGKNVDVEAAETGQTYPSIILLSRTVKQGCGRSYYDCPSVLDEEHKERTCTKRVEVVSDFDGQTYYHTCGKSYRRCMGHTRKHTGAWNTEHSDSVSTENPVVSPPPTPTPTPPPSPTYHACGDHETSVSGDHSLQASCSSTDSNGNSCTVTSFYACDSHTHSYPAPPPPPTTVACGGASYTGCSGASSRTAHHVPSCSNGCGNGYWTCSSTAIYNHETQLTCRRCGTSFTRCSNGTCTHNGQTYSYHWAQ
ncbi:hypothetical protein F4054_13395 [Candidatus Poribacteria bacterium]|nr:hypothetical protein [Candidatus Poribacteria bacterium]MYG09044.1 hypothetical protein [Candidatus Poribacteria bacterium]MYK23239.1 hypothetical protein [Candidatus Poribacteria bacterium]